jgi:hypothetical protein
MTSGSPSDYTAYRGGDMAAGPGRNLSKTRHHCLARILR